MYYFFSLQTYVNNRKLCADHPETVSNLDVLRFGYDIHFILEKRKPIAISTAKATEYKNIYTNQKIYRLLYFCVLMCWWEKGRGKEKTWSFPCFSFLYSYYSLYIIIISALACAINAYYASNTTSAPCRPAVIFTREIGSVGLYFCTLWEKVSPEIL